MIEENVLHKRVNFNMEDINELTHSNRVSKLCKFIGMAMELTNLDVYHLEVGGLFHDIGKIAIQEGTLRKPGPLTQEEWAEIMKHPEIGYKIICNFIELSEIANHILYHHERFDGTGYPAGLKGDEIPLMSRIISVADSYDAMTNQRTYKETFDTEMAVEELIINKGTQFDPNIVDIFIEKVLKLNG